MTIPKLVLPILLGVLAIDCLIEVGFIGSMVGYLHIANHDVPYDIASTSTTSSFGLYPKPAHLLVNQGHTSNGAAGTALILVSLLGAIVLWTEKRGRNKNRNSSVYTNVRTMTDGQGNHHSRRTRTLPSDFSWLHPTWVVFTVLSFLLTFSALIYTFVATAQTDASHSTIDLNVAYQAGRRKLFGHLDPYPDDSWTPENWYKAVLKLDFVDESLKGHIRHEVSLMEGWRWNLIPLFLLGFAVMVIAIMGWLERRRGGGVDRASSPERSQNRHVDDMSER